VTVQERAEGFETEPADVMVGRDRGLAERFEQMGLPVPTEEMAAACHASMVLPVGTRPLCGGLADRRGVSVRRAHPRMANHPIRRRNCTESVV
jgi:hypothetical protein